MARWSSRSSPSVRIRRSTYITATRHPRNGHVIVSDRKPDNAEIAADPTSLPPAYVPLRMPVATPLISRSGTPIAKVITM